MNELAEHLLDGLIEMEELVGASITWAGQDYPCTGGAEFGGKRLGEGGFRMQADVTVVCRLGVFDPGTGSPQEKQTLSYRSAPEAAARALRIKSVTPFRGAMLVIECEDPRTGA